ncbi:hypothetical protein P5673_006246 [Acropora cervicornis]|uniref:Uncharacterized protein n=1 Tax=Acropora cervicornis TaxID=6130 RepID=A0AAD9VCC8_ACRCE|nr:hypothetical protein P5673_006246 [Acropora cervicornis]
MIGKSFDREGVFVRFQETASEVALVSAEFGPGSTIFSRRFQRKNHLQQPRIICLQSTRRETNHGPEDPCVSVIGSFGDRGKKWRR